VQTSPCLFFKPLFSFPHFSIQISTLPPVSPTETRSLENFLPLHLAFFSTDWSSSFSSQSFRPVVSTKPQRPTSSPSQRFHRTLSDLGVFPLLNSIGQSLPNLSTAPSILSSVQCRLFVPPQYLGTPTCSLGNRIFTLGRRHRLVQTPNLPPPSPSCSLPRITCFVCRRDPPTPTCPVPCFRSVLFSIHTSTFPREF